MKTQKIGSVNRVAGNGVENSGEKKGKKSGITIPKIIVQKATILVVGTSPLICNRNSQYGNPDAQQGRLDKASAKGRSPEQCMHDALYEISPGRYGFPASAFKRALIEACTHSQNSYTKTFIRGAIQVVGGPLFEIKGSLPTMHKDTVRQNRVPAPRYRAQFLVWSIEVPVLFTQTLDLEEVVYLFSLAGFHVGVGDKRPQQGHGNGMFQVKAVS